MRRRPEKQEFKHLLLEIVEFIENYIGGFLSTSRETALEAPQVGPFESYRGRETSKSDLAVGTALIWAENDDQVLYVCRHDVVFLKIGHCLLRRNRMTPHEFRDPIEMAYKRFPRLIGDLNDQLKKGIQLLNFDGSQPGELLETLRTWLRSRCDSPQCRHLVIDLVPCAALMDPSDFNDFWLPTPEEIAVILEGMKDLGFEKTLVVR